MVAYIGEYTTQVRLMILGFPAVLGLLRHRTSPTAGFSILLHSFFNPTFAYFSGCRVQPQFDISSVEGAEHQLGYWQSLRRICRYRGQNTGGSFWISLVRLPFSFVTSPFFDAVLDGAVTAQYKMSNNLKNHRMSRRTPCPSVSHHCYRESVLHGAFSTYKCVASQNDVHGERLLQKHFLGETMVRRSLLS